MSRVFAVFGGLLFVGSLLFFVFSFGWRFESDGTWSWSSGWRPVLIDIALFTLFALHHSIFARTGLKRWVERMWPPELERSMYVWIASLLFLAVCAAWQPVPGALWRLSGPIAAALRAAQLGGAILAVASARRLDTLALAGVRQVLDTHRGAARAHETTTEIVLDRGPYRFVRHPIYLGWFLMVWCTPQMTGTRLVFAAISCAYLIVAIPFEERDLERMFGGAYGQYRKRVRRKVLPGVY